jgi:hypothetical protein
MVKKAKKVRECVFCGVPDPTTRDHVPPECLYPSPPPPNLITVPACRTCNESFMKDDEWLRLVLTIRENIKTNPDRNAVLPSVQASVMNPSAPGFRKAFKRDLQLVPRFSPSGLYMGLHAAYVADGARLDGMAKRMTKGLFYKVKGHRLPGTYGVNALNLSRLNDASLAGTEFKQVALDSVALLKQEQTVTKGDTFSYRWLQSPNGPERTIWLLSFYGRDEYFCTTAPLEEGAGAQ